MVTINNLATIKEILINQDGVILSKNLTKRKIPRVYLKNMLEKGELEKIERGIYITDETWEDEMFMLQLKYPKVIFSHETALFLHGLTEVTPNKLDVTVPKGYNSKTLLNKHVKIRYISKEKYDIGITTTLTEFGREVKVYDIERTLCDIVRKKSKCDIRFINTAFKEYLSHGGFNLDKLHKYAKIFQTEKTIRKYLSVLL